MCIRDREYPYPVPPYPGYPDTGFPYLVKPSSPDTTLPDTENPYLDTIETVVLLIRRYSCTSKNGCYESPCAVTGGTIRKELNTGLEEEPKCGP